MVFSYFFRGEKPNFITRGIIRYCVLNLNRPIKAPGPTTTLGEKMPYAHATAIHISRTLFSLSPNSKRSIARTLAQQAAADLDLHLVGINDILQQRIQDPVAIGGGVAVIDCMVDHLEQPYMLVARLNHQVDFQAADSRAVDLICVLLSPGGDPIAHIRNVGRLTRLMRNDGLRANLRSASSADAMSALLMSPVEHVLAA